MPHLQCVHHEIFKPPIPASVISNIASILNIVNNCLRFLIQDTPLRTPKTPRVNIDIRSARQISCESRNIVYNNEKRGDLGCVSLLSVTVVPEDHVRIRRVIDVAPQSGSLGPRVFLVKEEY